MNINTAKCVMLHTLFVVVLLLSQLTLANEANVTLLVKDYTTQSPFPNLKVHAYAVQGDGKLQWFDANYTNEQGIAQFSLPNLNEGQTYRFSGKVYNNKYSYSLYDISQAGDYTFEIGNVTVSLRDGSQESAPPLVDSNLTFYQILPNGTKQWFDSAKSDENGIVKINLPAFEQGISYQLVGKSPTTNENKEGEIITSSGNYGFTVGNKPVHLTFKDDATKQAITDLSVTAYQLNDDGSRSWIKRFKTNAAGQVSFDLDNIDSATNYSFALKAFNNFQYYTQPIQKSGQHQINIGKFRATLVDGSQSTTPPLINMSTSIYEVDAAGKKHHVGNALTDANGQIKIDLNGLTQGKHYQLKAKSPVDGSNQYSDILTTNGPHKFTVGSPALNVIVKDAYTDLPITEQKVYVYQKQEDGKYTWYRTRYTDASGRLSLDLPGLGVDRHYKLRATVYNKFATYSPELTTREDFVFKIGAIKLNLVSGVDQSHMSNTRVDVFKINGDKYQWVNKVVTDEHGVARFDLTFTQSEQYTLKAASPSSGAAKYSDRLTSQGDFTFQVGNPAVVVSLTNYLTNSTYPDQSIHAFKINADQSLSWTTKAVTDENGVAHFDLEGLDQDSQYVFKTSIFNGISSYSDVVMSPGAFNFKVGKLPMTLENKDGNTTLANVKLTLYELSGSGNIKWHSAVKTDANGFVTFDPEGLTQGQRYVVKASNPFGESKSYYGPIVNNPGHVLFSLKQGESRSLDLIDPTVEIARPLGSSVPNTGFWVTGQAYDNQAINRITLKLADSLKGTQEVEIDPSNSNWRVFVPNQYLTLNGQLTITATAYDYALNSASKTLTLAIVEDNQAPVINVVSPSANDNVNSRGFSILGSVHDDYDVASLTLSLNDSQLGNSIENVSLQESKVDGQWAYFINENAISTDSELTLTLNATDYAGNQAEHQLVLSASELNPKLDVLVRRATFGITPDLQQQLNQDIDFLTAQLSPETIDDSAFEAQMDAMPVTNLRELKEYYLAYMLGSKKQLREVMTWFWENHFNTFYHTHRRVQYEFNENQAFREHALGNFNDLLLVSAKSPAMLRYLNNAQNNKDAPNENYAREIMELHTLGIDGGYTAEDVAALSRIFTGWHVRDNAFYFRESQHDFGEKTFLGETYFGDGLSDGEKAVNVLANHPATAAHLCTKLATFFVSETPSTSLINQCQAQFLATSGSIKHVLEVIFNSSDLTEQSTALSKLKTPLELITSAVRNTNATVDLTRSIRTLNAMGMPLFENPVPTGYSEVSEDWLNANAVMLRLQFVNQSAWRGNNGVQQDISALLISLGYTQSDAIITYLFELLLANQFSQLEYDTAKAILVQEGEFDIYGENANEQLTRLLATIMSFPNYQLQ